MRLSPRERQIITHAVRQRFGKAARAWLFGSRTDDQARGGDIDLLVRIPQPIDNDFLATLALETDLQEALGDQKIDILLLHPGTRETPLHRIAERTGVAL
jgi:predicted nucleotidyltransferase